jgi:hypothetical protein
MSYLFMERLQHHNGLGFLMPPSQHQERTFIIGLPIMKEKKMRGRREQP